MVHMVAPTWPYIAMSDICNFGDVTGPYISRANRTNITGVYLKGVQTKANQTKNTRPMKDHLECTELREKLTV